MSTMTKALQFPNNADSYFRLARYKHVKGDCASAIRFAYDALLHNGDGEDLTCFMANELLVSGNPDEALRLLFTEFYDPDERIPAVSMIIQECYRAMHEYIQERRISIDLAKSGEELYDPDTPYELSAVLENYDAMLNDNILFGTDISSLNEIWCEARPIMDMCAVFAAVDDLHHGDPDKAAKTLLPAIRHAIETERTLPSSFALDNTGIYILSEVLSENPENAMKCVEDILSCGSNSTQSLVNIGALALIAALSSGNEKAVCDIMKDIPLPKSYELNAIASINLLVDNIQKAYDLYSTELSYSPYNIGLNIQVAYCATQLGDMRKSYECYDKLTKLLPWDKSLSFYRHHCLAKLNNDTASIAFSDENILPSDRQDRVNAAIAFEDRIGAMLNKPLPEFESELTHEDAEILVSFIPAMQKEIQLDIIRILSESHDDKVWTLLKRLLLDRNTSRDAKDLILRNLMKLKPKKKLVCCVDGNFIEAFPLMHTDFETFDALYGAYKKSYDTAKRSYSMLCALALNSYFEYYIEVCRGFCTIKEELTTPLAALLLAMATKRTGYEDSLDFILNKYYQDTNNDDIYEVVEYLDECERGYMNDLYGNM